MRAEAGDTQSSDFSGSMFHVKQMGAFVNGNRCERGIVVALCRE
jgi:hypothetical protein